MIGAWDVSDGTGLLRANQARAGCDIVPSASVSKRLINGCNRAQPGPCGCHGLHRPEHARHIKLPGCRRFWTSRSTGILALFEVGFIQAHKIIDSSDSQGSAMTDIEIRAATEADMPEVVRIYAYYIASTVCS